MQRTLRIDLSRRWNMTQRQSLDVSACRRRFPGLGRQVAGQPAIFFDGPGGTQVPQRVIDAVADCLAHRNANDGGLFATSRESGTSSPRPGRPWPTCLTAPMPTVSSSGPT